MQFGLGVFGHIETKLQLIMLRYLRSGGTLRGGVVDMALTGAAWGDAFVAAGMTLTYSFPI